MQFKKTVDEFYYRLVETRIIYYLLGFSILLSYYLLYIFRSADNTVLMGWNLIFNTGTKIYELLFIQSICILLSFIISRKNIASRYNHEKYHILFLFISGFLIGSLFWNIPEINPDAARYFTEAKYLKEYGIMSFLKDWGGEIFTWVDFPTVPFFYGIIFKYLGEYREFVLIFNTIFLSLTSVLTYKISKKLWNEEVGLSSGLLLMSFPYLLSQVPLMLVDIPLMFLIILSIFYVLKIFENSYYCILAPLIIFFTIYAKMSSILIILPPIISILIIKQQSVIKNKYRWISTLIFSAGLIIPFYLWKMRFFNQNAIAMIIAKQENTHFEGPFNYFFQIGFIIIISAIFSLITEIKKKDINYFILVAWILIPFLMFHNTRIRQIIAIFPAIAIMSSIAINSINNNNIKKFLITSIFLTSIAFTACIFIPFEENFTDKNIKNGAEFTNKLDMSEIQLFLDFSDKFPYNPDPIVALFDIYSHKKIRYSNETKFYTINDFSNQWTAFYKIPSFYYENKDPKLTHADRINVIISDKDFSDSIPAKYFENYTLIKTFDSKTISVMNPAYVKIYIPQNNP